MKTEGAGTWTVETKIVRKDGTIEKTVEKLKEEKKNGNVRR